MSSANVFFDEDPMETSKDFFLYNEFMKNEEDEESDAEENDGLLDFSESSEDMLEEFSSQASSLADRMRDAGSDLSDVGSEVSQLLSDVRDAASELDDDSEFDELISTLEAVDSWFSTDGDMCSSELSGLASDLDMASL